MHFFMDNSGKIHCVETGVSYEQTSGHIIISVPGQSPETVDDASGTQFTKISGLCM